MTWPKFSLNINKSLFVSAFLHGALFVVALSLATPNIIPLPLGVEVLLGQGGTRVAPKTEVSKPMKMKTAVVADDSEAPALKNEKVETPVSVTSSEKSAGSLSGASDKGAVTGKEGVANGIEVASEQRYLYEISKLLERKKRYPPLAKKLGQTGKVVMRFTLAADGKLLNSEVVEKSPYDSLNKAASDLVKSIDGLKPFPQEMKQSSWVMTVPIEYLLN